MRRKGTTRPPAVLHVHYFGHNAVTTNLATMP